MTLSRSSRQKRRSYLPSNSSMIGSRKTLLRPSAFYGKGAEILMAPMEYLEYSDLVKTLPLPTNMNIVATENPKDSLSSYLMQAHLLGSREYLWGVGDIGPEGRRQGVYKNRGEGNQEAD